jgi:hypothetical protein
MKKILLLSMVLAVFVTSCSKDNAVEPVVVVEPVDPNSILVKSIIVKDASNSVVQSNTFTYNGKKLYRMVDKSNYTTEFFYSENGNGTRIIKLQESNSNNALSKNVDYIYLANGKMDEISQTLTRSGYLDKYRYKFDYSTINNGYVSYTSFFSTTSGGVFLPEITGESGKIYFNGENVSKVESTDNTNLQSNKTYNIIYDTKNSPFKNVIGFQAISDYDYIFLYKVNLSSKINNIIDFRRPSYNSSGAVTNTFVDSYSYNFNEYNFPKTASIAKENLANNNSVTSSTINTVVYGY